MFRKMRRSGQELPKDECEAILHKESDGVLAVLGDAGYPYAVPVNYVYHEGKIIFHSAVAGHKVDAMSACPNVSFCVIAQRDVVAEKLTTYFRSVIVFGKVRRLSDETEIRAAARILGMRFLPDTEAVEREIEQLLPRLACYVIDIEHCTGKQCKELIKRP